MLLITKCTNHDQLVTRSGNALLQTSRWCDYIILPIKRTLSECIVHARVIFHYRQMPHNCDINSDIIPHAIIQSSMTSQFSHVVQDAHKSRRRPASLNCTWINPPSGGHANLAQQKPPRIPEAVRVRLRDHLHNTAAARIRFAESSFRFGREGLLAL